MTTPTSFTWTGLITFTGAVDPTTTNVATLTLTPQAGQTTLPAVLNGTPGLPPVLRNVTVTQVAAGVTLPAPSWTVVDPGGAGEASIYDLAISVNAGATGANGTNAMISTAGDVEGGPVGTATDGYTLYYNAADAKWKISVQRRITGPYIALPSNFSAGYSGAAGQYAVASIGVPALPYAWRPDVHAQLMCGGTINTKVDLAVRLGDPSTGQQVGYGLGQYGVGPYPVTAGPGFGAAVAGSSTFGEIAANTASTFYLVAVQTASTNDLWNTLNTNGRFSVLAVPV